MVTMKPLPPHHSPPRSVETLRIEFQAVTEHQRIQVMLNAPGLPMFGGLFRSSQQTLTMADMIAVQRDYLDQLHCFHGLDVVPDPGPLLNGLDVVPDPGPLLNLGRRVATLLPATARQGIITAVDRARRRGCPLQIILECTEETREVLLVPWELIALPWQGGDRDDFLLLDATITLVRQVRGAGVQRPPQLRQPLTVQALLADPLDGEPIDYAPTYAALEQTLTPPVAAASWYAGVGTLSALAERLRLHSPQVLHLLCHGQEATLSAGAKRHDLIFTHEDGQQQRVSAFELAPLLSLAPQLQMILLQACYSGSTPPQTSKSATDSDSVVGARRAIESIALALVRKGVPAVVAMQGQVAQDAAAIFIQTLYSELQRGQHLDGAVAAGRLAMHAAGSALDWSLPVVYQGSRPADPVTWYTRLADRAGTALRDPAVQRMLRGMVLLWALILLVGGISLWLLVPEGRKIPLTTPLQALRIWVGVGLTGPAIIAAGQRDVAQRAALDRKVRRAVRYAQWGGAYMGFALAGIVGLSLWVTLWLLGAFAWMPAAWAWFSFGIVLLAALGASYIISRSQQHSAMILTQVDASIFDWRMLLVLLVVAVTLLAVPFFVLFLLSNEFAGYCYLGPAAIALALILVSMVILGGRGSDG
ncbi:MAG: CHAT domain-containing protein [Candidatus Viridilinea halotolerans]|uniref:CHAT domain-containing protein n=1 Tax=Candidatus Viridilinea halotolerans TaxID=2491704 RepID=A0A426TYC9_9CHLR|nr:MAG: CHAT domain-containing protein [Candidatus Viridilinea halotolerans]